MPFEIAEAREKSALANPLWHDSEAQRLEIMAKKHKIPGKAIDNVITNYTTIFKRSGFNYSKRLISLTVENNAVRLKSLNVIKDNVPTAKNQTSTTFNMTKRDIGESGHVTFLTGEAKTARKGFDIKKIIEQPEQSLVNRMMTYKPSESTECMRSIGKILHPQIPERYLSLQHTMVTPFNIVGKYGE